ncbi:MAG: hypothetical protein ABNH26_01905 [Celeribacter sp.]|jgi:hypothetical protein
MQDIFTSDDALFDTRPWRRIDMSCLAPASGVPTMLSETEQKLYYWLTRVWARGHGAIVDLGCFAGGSTARLALGHGEAGLTSPIHAYDRFTAQARVKRRVLYPQGIAPFEGEDILPLVRDLLSPWSDHITLHPGQIEDQRWQADPIEILVMDAGKTASGLDRMAEIFFPHLIPGQSLLVQQDYLQWNQPWVAVQMEMLTDFFVPRAHARPDTVVWECTRPVTPGALARAQVSELPDDTMLAYLELAHERFESWNLGKRIDTLIRALRANPGQRAAHDFEHRP